MNEKGKNLSFAERYAVNAQDREVLRRLGQEVYNIALEPVNAERITLWRKLNDLQAERPMIWYNDIPWHELNVNDELTLTTTGAFAQEWETALRRTIYQWKHFSGDMVVDPFLSSPKIYTDTAFGIEEDVDITRTDENNDIYSRHFRIQIQNEEDLEKIQMPVIAYQPEETAYALQCLQDVFAGVMDVRLIGKKNIWFTPWDFLVRWWGIEEVMIDLYERPEMVHKAYIRMVDAWMAMLDQLEAQNLLTLDCDNSQVGSGAYGYVSDLPGKDYEPDHVRSHNMWGCTNAQIFAVVSPDMHWEFSLQHDLRWLARFGLTYYGCCEPLDNKMHLLKRIPNLRKVSVSAWADVKKMADGLGRDYVLSRKPNPAVLAGDAFAEEQARQDLMAFQAVSAGLNVEYIMKDISTVGYDPVRLWQWDALVKKIVMQ